MGDPKKLVTDLLTAGGFDYDDDKVNSLISNYGSDYTKMAQDLLTAGSFEYDDDKVNQLLGQYKLNTRNTQKTVDAFGTEQTIDWGNNTVETTYNPEKVKAKAKEIASSKNKTSTEVMPGVTQTIDWENNEYNTEVVDEERRDTYLENKRAADEQKASQRATYQGGVGFPGGYNYIPQTDQDLDIATSRADRAMADYEKAVEDSQSNWWDDIKVSASDVGLANLGLIQLGRYLPFKNPLAGERQKQEVEREKKIQAAEEIKAKTIENLTEDDLKPLSFEDIYQYQATQSTNVEDATNKTLFQLKKNSDRLGVVEDYFYKKLSEEEQALALRLKQGDTSVQVDQLSPEFGKWYGSYDNLSKQKGLIKDNVDKYTGVLQFIGNQIGEFKNQNLDDDTIENNLIKSLNELKREKPEWTYEIEDAKQLVSGWDAAIVEGGWWSMLGSLGINTANKVRNSINSVGKGLKSGFFYENAISNLTKGEVDDTLKEEFGRDMRDLLAAPSSQFTAGFSSNVVEKGGLKLIVDEDGQVIDVRNKDNKKIFYPTEEQVKIIESYNPEYDGKGKQTYSGASIAYTTLQVASDMIPMIAASAVSGGSALGVAIGAGSTMYGSYYNEALQKTGDMSRASVYALVATGLTSYVESKIGKLEQKIGRSLSGTEKAAIRRSALEASEATAERGIRSYVEGRGAMTWLKDKTARLPELANDIKGELLEEYSNFGVDAVSAAVADIPSESVRGEELEETFLITSLISGTLGGGRIIASNAQEINEMLGYAAMKKDKFEQIGENWVNSATTDKEKELRRKDFEAKRTAVAEVSDMNAYLNEQDFSDEKKDELFNLALDKAKKLYQAGASNSQKSKEKYLTDAATIEKEINRVAEDLGGKPFYVPEKPAGAEAEEGAEAEVVEPSKRGFVTQDEFNSLKESGAVPADVTFEQFSELPLERQQEFRTAKLDNTKRRAEQVQALLDDDTAEREASGEGNLSSKGRQKLEEELTTLQNQIKQEEDAIQKQGAAAVSVQPEPEVGAGVGGQVQPEPEVTTGEGQEVEGQVQLTKEEIDAEIAKIEANRKEELASYGESLNEAYEVGSEQTVEEYVNAKYNAQIAALEQAAQATKAAGPTPTPTTPEKAAPKAAEGPKLPQFAVPLSQNERQVVQRGEEGSVNQFKLIRDSLEPVQRGKKKLPSEMEQAITSGAITADQAIEAIESAGLTVPKKIADLKKKQDAKLQETANRAPGQIQAFEVKRKDGTTVPAANYTKNPDTGKWSRVNEQGKETTVTSQLMIQQLEAEETRLQQESQRAAEQLARPKAEPAKVAEIKVSDVKVNKAESYDSDGTWDVTYNGEVIAQMYYDKATKTWRDPARVSAGAFEDIWSTSDKKNAIDEIVSEYNKKQKEQAKGEGVEKTEQKAETKPETATTKPAPKPEVAESATAKAEEPAPKKPTPVAEEPVAVAEEPAVEEEEISTAEKIAEAERAAEQALKEMESIFGFSASNKAQIDALENTASTKVMRDTILAAKRLTRILKSIFPNMEIYLHTDPNLYRQRMREIGGTVNSSGNFSYTVNSKGDIVRGHIDINLSSANPVTVAHEVAHAVMLRTFGNNPKLFKKFRDSISKMLLDKANENLKVKNKQGETVSYSEALEEFENLYKGEETAPEEYLVQLTAFLSDNGGAILKGNPTLFEKIVSLMNSIISKATGGRFSPFKDYESGNTKMNNEIINFFNSVSQSLSNRPEDFAIDVLVEKGTSLAKLIADRSKDIDVIPSNDYFVVNKASALTPEPDKIVSPEKVDADALAIMNSYDFVNSDLDLQKSNTVDININVDELNSRLDTPLNKVKWEDFLGLPFMFTISDQLTTGNVVNPITGQTINNLKGGLGFNGTTGNTGSAWANMGDKEAISIINKATNIYSRNKELFKKLWKEGKLPNGHVPMAVVKMAEGSILSNEAVFRVGVQNISTLPEDNRKKAVTVLKEILNNKIVQLKNQLKENEEKIKENKIKEKKGLKPDKVDAPLTVDSKRKRIGSYTEILRKINTNGYTDILQIMQNISKFTLPQRALITGEIFFGTGATKPGGPSVSVGKPKTPVSVALIGNANPALIHIGAITDLITEQTIKDIPSNHIISIVGVNVVNPEVTTTTHPNYAKGVKGVSIGVLDKPIHMKDAFGEAYSNAVALAARKESEKTSFTTPSLLSEGIPVGAGLPNKVLEGAVSTNNIDAIDKLNGFLRQVFPSTSFFTTQDAWDAVMENGSIDKKSVDGDILYGFTSNGNIYINPNIKTTKASLHEMGHLWSVFVKESNPKLYERGLELTKDTEELKKAIEQYGDTDLAKEEALVQLMSTKGDTIVDAAQKAKFKEWLLTLWKYVKDNFKSLLDIPEDRVQDITLDQFLNGMLADILSGQELVPPKKAKKGKVAKDILPARDPDLALGEDEVVINKASKVYDETGFISVPSMIEIVASNDPTYLGRVLEHIQNMGEKLKSGNVSVKDLSKAYLMAIASVQTTGQNPKNFESNFGEKVDPIFLELNGQLRGEGAMAALLSSDRGSKMLDNISQGKVLQEDIDLLSKSMNSYGLWSPTGTRMQSLFGPTKKDQINLTNIADLREFFKKGVKNKEELFKNVGKLKLISQGKIGFVSNFLGVGSRGVIDSREMDGWLSGFLWKDNKKVLEEEMRDRGSIITKLRKELLKNTKVLNPTQVTILERMAQVGLEFNIPSEQAGYLGHHMTWDAVAGEKNLHQGLYLAMSQNQSEFNTNLAKFRLDRATMPKEEIIINKASKLSGTPKDFKNTVESLKDIPKEKINELKNIIGGKVKEPIKTEKAYKLFRVNEKYPGQLFPLFVNAKESVLTDTWVEAVEGEYYIDAKGRRMVKSSLGPLAYRPGWHSGDSPVATHIGGKVNKEDKKPSIRPENQVWAEVEVANDFDWQTEALSRANYTKAGKMILKTAHITDQIPFRGYYKYKTNANMTGSWLISGEMKVIKVLNDDEVKALNKESKVRDLKRSTPLDLKKYGFNENGAPISQEDVDANQIANAYIKAKQDNNNPELVKAVEDLIGGEEVTVSKASREATTPFDVYDPGKDSEESHSMKINAIVNTIKTQIKEGRLKNVPFTKAKLKKLLTDTFKLDINDQSIDVLWGRATGSYVGSSGETITYPRTIQRVLMTPSIPNKIKQILETNTKPKEVVTDEDLEVMADSILEDADMAETNEAAIEEYDRILSEVADSFGLKAAQIMSGEKVFLYEIRVMKRIAEGLKNMEEYARAAEVLERISNIGSLNGTALREIGLNYSSDAIYIQTLSKSSEKLRKDVLNSETRPGSQVTNQERIDEITDVVSESLNKNKDQMAENAAAKVDEIAKNKNYTPGQTASADTTADSKGKESTSKMLDKIAKKLDGLANPYYESFQKGMKEFFSGFKSGIDPIAMARISKDFLMYAFYKTAGNIVKARAMFLAIKELAPAHKNVDQYIEELNKSEIPEATKTIAQLKILEALQSDEKVSPKNMTPAQLIAMRVKALDQKSSKVKPRPKSLAQKIEEGDLDIATLTGLRDAIEAELMPYSNEKRAEILSRIDDLLVQLRGEKLKNRAAPWIKKTQIRADLKNGLKSLNQTVKDLVDDFANIDVYTKSIGEEFILRTGMTAEEAAPFIKAIEEEIKAVVEKQIAKDLLDSEVERLSKDRGNLVDSINQKKEKISDLENEIAQLDKKSKTDAEYERYKKAKQELSLNKKILKKYEARLAKFDKDVENKARSKDFRRILYSISNGGLTNETVVNSLAETLGIETITKSQLDHIGLLSEKIKNAMTAADQEVATKELKSYLYSISNTSFLDSFYRMFEAYSYANMLSSPRTAEVAFVSGILGLMRDVGMNFIGGLAKDILNIAPITYRNGIKVKKSELDFKNMRIMLDTFIDIFGKNRIFDATTFYSVLKGAEGISIQQTDISQKTKDRLTNSLSEIDKANTIIDRIKSDPQWSKSPKKIASVAALEAFKLQQRMARLLVAADYLARSIALPYAVRMTASEIAMESLPVQSSYKEIQKKTNELINRGKAKELAELKRQEMEAKGIKFDAAKYERKIALESLPEEVQKQAKEYVDRLAWTGRITGYTGWLADKTSNTFEAIKGDPIMPGDDTNTKAFKTFRNIVGTVIKLTTLPFSSVLFRGIQQIKNVVPFLGLFQRRMTLDENGKYVPTGTGLQYFELFREYRYYNASKNVYDTVRATNWEVFNRAAYSLLPGTLAFLLFQSMFTFGFDDEEEDKIYNELGFFSPDKFRMFLSGKGRFKADLTSNTLITGDYDTDMKSIMEGMGIQYEPNSVYRKTKDGSFAKVPIVGSYKDAPYGVFLSALAAVQERLLFAKEVAGGSKVVRDPLGPGEVFSIMALSGVGFLSEFGLSGALDQLKAVAGLLSGDAEEIGDINRALKKSAQTGVRQLVPGAAFASFWANLKGMYKDEDRRKGMGILESAIANTYVIEDFLDTYDYDALGKKLPYQESPYPVLGSIERAVASLNNDNYTLLTNSTFKDRQTYADQLRSRFLDLASTIRKQTPRDVAKTEMTVISEFDEKTKYQIGMDAGTYKAQMLEENAETLEKYWEAYQFGDLEEKVSSKGDYASTLNAVNNIGNDQAYCDRVLEILENNADEIESNSGLVVSTVRDEITADSKLISNTILGDSKYYKKSKLIDLLYLNNLAIDKDGKIVYNKKYSEIYTDEAHDQYMISNQNEF